jgi:polyhydroxyalkanoate synthesis regulator phasin
MGPWAEEQAQHLLDDFVKKGYIDESRAEILLTEVKDGNTEDGLEKIVNIIADGDVRD